MILYFVIIYSDGVGRTGTFICLHSQLERLKTEGVVDFFQAVKSALILDWSLMLYVTHTHLLLLSLCHFHYLPSQDEYAYCHEVLADFVNSYDNYANFKEVM